jgi:hypothetical protein
MANRLRRCVVTALESIGTCSNAHQLQQRAVEKLANCDAGLLDGWGMPVLLPPQADVGRGASTPAGDAETVKHWSVQLRAAESFPPMTPFLKTQTLLRNVPVSAWTGTLNAFSRNTMNSSTVAGEGRMCVFNSLTALQCCACLASPYRSALDFTSAVCNNSCMEASRSVDLLPTPKPSDAISVASELQSAVGAQPSYWHTGHV